MLEAEWENLCDRLQRRSDVARVAKELDGKYTIDTLLSIHNQNYIRKMMRHHRILKNVAPQFVRMYKDGKSLLEIAEWMDFSPCMVVRKVMEDHFSLSKKKITEMFRDPSLIKDERLQRETRQAIDSDLNAGPRFDRWRACLGFKYEHILFGHLRNLGLQFETEHDLRKRGTHKTPDVLLHLPVAFRGKIVRWIDSKAKFGCKFFLEKDYFDSVQSYVGRFGPGLIIYWFGFITDCNTPMLRDAGVLVSDCFPEDVLMLPGASSIHKSKHLVDVAVEAGIDEIDDVES